ncbi:hypothetical protein BGX21_009627, partial [Mortierella sp. AD011]
NTQYATNTLNCGFPERAFGSEHSPFPTFTNQLILVARYSVNAGPWILGGTLTALTTDKAGAASEYYRYWIALDTTFVLCDLLL